MTAISGTFHDYHEPIDMAEAVRRAFSNYSNFSGRSKRGEFWWFFLATTIVNIVLTMIDSTLWTLPILSLLWTLVLFIPGLALTVRRFHDIGKSGWAILIVLIPIVGIVLYLVWLCRQGEPKANRFG